MIKIGRKHDESLGSQPIGERLEEIVEAPPGMQDKHAGTMPIVRES
jgi:hypothetical protein